MKRITFAIATALILGALTLALPKLKSDAKAKPVAKPAAPKLIPGDGACNNVQFKIQNNRRNNEKIRATKVEFYLSGLGWRNEDVNNFTTGDGDCPNGSLCYTRGQNLQRADGRQVTKFKLHYKYQGSGPGQNEGWSNVVVSREFVVPASNQLCNGSQSYGTLVVGQQ